MIRRLQPVSLAKAIKQQSQYVRQHPYASHVQSQLESCVHKTAQSPDAICEREKHLGVSQIWLWWAVNRSMKCIQLSHFRLVQMSRVE